MAYILGTSTDDTLLGTSTDDTLFGTSGALTMADIEVSS